MAKNRLPIPRLWKQHLSAWGQLTRLDKPIGALLLLWPTLWALWIAGHGRPSWGNVLVFTLGTILMRSVGCILNDLADRKLDGHVKRTCQRPLVTGEVTTQSALALAAGLSLAALLLVSTRNALTWKLSLPALFLAASYPYTKRFFPLPQAYLGIAFGFGIPMAFAAQTGQVPRLAWHLLLANIFWTMAYDTEYAMVDRDDDANLGIHSSALLFGSWDVRAIMLCYAGALGMLAELGLVLNLGPPYYMGLLAAGGMALYHYWLIRERRREGCFAAFRHNNWFGAVIFSGIVLDSLSQRS